MKTKYTRAAAALAALLVCAMAIIAAPTADAYTPPVQTVKIGLRYGTDTMTSANLLNASGLGSGYEFGYYNDRDFVSLAAYTDETAITMMMDRNMYYYSDGSVTEYREGTSGSIVVGCFHVQLAGVYSDFETAKAAAAGYEGAFVKYDTGSFVVCLGEYTTRDEANGAAGQHSGSSVTAGTANTITVVKTGTDTILFEFDYGTQFNLAVVPRPAADEKCAVWFKGYKYYGGFSYARPEGLKLSVINYVNIEDYVKGVIPYEMNNAWPMEALKAQACCARTYVMRKINNHKSAGFDLCTLEHCQVYHGLGGSTENYRANERTDAAVDETAGMYITYNGELCETYYASTNGGASENSENVWYSALPYLRGVIDPYEADVAGNLSNYRWTITYTPEQISQRLRDKGYTRCATVVSVTVTEYTPTGNVLTVTIKDDNGTTFNFKKRDDLIKALGVKTQRFTIGEGTYTPGGIYVNGEDDKLTEGESVSVIGGDGVTAQIPSGGMYAIGGSGEVAQVVGEPGVTTPGGSGDGKVGGVFTINGTGNGHNVGMSQWGAYSMAQYHGKTYIDIIKFYFTGVTVG